MEETEVRGCISATCVVQRHMKGNGALQRAQWAKIARRLKQERRVSAERRVSETPPTARSRVPPMLPVPYAHLWALVPPQHAA